MTFYPLGRRVLVRPVLPANETTSGLELVKNYQPVTMGDVIGVGEQVIEVMLGERVIFPDTVGLDVVVDGAKLLLLDERDLSAVVAADAERCPLCCRPLEEALHG